jgi:NADPH2:quinone reductase
MATDAFSIRRQAVQNLLIWDSDLAFWVMPGPPYSIPEAGSQNGIVIRNHPRTRTMAKVIRFHETGGADVLKFEDAEVGEPGAGEARVRHSFIAVNFADVYFRTGVYPLALPNGLGTDAVGVVEAVGPGVTDIRVGDRVGYLVGPPGAYSQVRVMPANVLIPLPDGISDRTAASLIMKGMTAQYLFRQVYPLKGGETILYHAAAGGVGLIACQWARALGVTMIGTVSTDEKAAVAKAHGCTHTIVTSRENIAERVREITNGLGVPVVYDSIGKDTLEASLDSLQVRGTFVSNGTSSGPVVFNTGRLATKGSLWFTRPAMRHYIEPRSHMLDMARELFDLVLSGHIVSEPKQSFALADAADAHRALEGRKTIGSTVLVP